MICYVLPVLWMTSYLLISQGRRPGEAQCTRSLGLGYKLCAVIPVAGQRTHGTTFRALKVTSEVATLGAESAVYDCLVLRVVFIQSWKFKQEEKQLEKCHVRETSMSQTASCKLNYCKIGDIFVDVGEERCHGNCTLAGNHSRCWGNGPHLCQRCEFWIDYFYAIKRCC